MGVSLAGFGRRARARTKQVIHPKTMVPAYQGGEAIPIYIKNTFNPAGPGTRIFLPDSCALRSRGEMAGFSTVDNVAVVNVEGSGRRRS